MLLDENKAIITPIPKTLGVNGLEQKQKAPEVQFSDASFKWVEDHAEPNLSNVTGMLLICLQLCVHGYTHFVKKNYFIIGKSKSHN